MEVYKDRNASVEERLEDLLGRMTIEEKLGQMVQADGRQEPEKTIAEQKVGSFLHTIGERAVELQKYASERTRLGIPLIFGIDAIHGHAFWPGATVFPTQLGSSCAWDAELMEEIGRVTAREMAVTGMHWTFAPVFCLARDLRWGRIDETFGEDPYLLGVLGSGLIRGLQGKSLADPESVLACAKHFAGYSETQGGRDSSEADLSERKLRSFFLPPFQAACQAGCATYMTGYQSIDGVPNTISRKLLVEILKEEWGFEGFVVTDWNNVARLLEEQKIFEEREDCAKGAVEAGNDMTMTTPFFFPEALKAIEKGRLDVELVHRACRRVLRLKLEMGLFDDKRYPDLDARPAVIGVPAHREVALKAARESLVLLKNDGLLPLKEEALKVAVVGPNAADPLTQLGDWSMGSSSRDGDLLKGRFRAE